MWSEHANLGGNRFLREIAIRCRYTQFCGMTGYILLKLLHQERVDHFGSIVRNAFLEARVKLQSMAGNTMLCVRHG